MPDVDIGDVPVVDIVPVESPVVIEAESLDIVDVASLDVVVVVLVSVASFFCDEQAVVKATTDSAKKADFTSAFIVVSDVFVHLMLHVSTLYTAHAER